MSPKKSREYLPSDTKNIFAVCSEKYRRRYKYSRSTWKNIRAKIISHYLAHLEIVFREIFASEYIFLKTNSVRIIENIIRQSSIYIFFSTA